MHSVGHICSRPGEGGTEAPGPSFLRILAGRYCLIPDDAPNCCWELRPTFHLRGARQPGSSREHHVGSP
jgi:hypothetical protein